MRNAIAGMKEWIELAGRGEVRGDVDFLHELHRNLEWASEQRLIFAIGY